MFSEENRLPYPLELIITGIHFLFHTKMNGSKFRNKNESIRSLLLYNFAVLDENLIPLNRDYKPIGLEGYSLWTKYENYPFLFIPKKNVDLFCLSKEGISEHWFLFNDLTFPGHKKMKQKYAMVVGNIFKCAYPSIEKRIEEVVGDFYF